MAIFGVERAGDGHFECQPDLFGAGHWPGDVLGWMDPGVVLLPAGMGIERLAWGAVFGAAAAFAHPDTDPFRLRGNITSAGPRQPGGA